MEADDEAMRRLDPSLACALAHLILITTRYARPNGTSRVKYRASFRRSESHAQHSRTYISTLSSRGTHFRSSSIRPLKPVPPVHNLPLRSPSQHTHLTHESTRYLSTILDSRLPLYHAHLRLPCNHPSSVRYATHLQALQAKGSSLGSRRL